MFCFVQSFISQQFETFKLQFPFCLGPFAQGVKILIAEKRLATCRKVLKKLQLLGIRALSCRRACKILFSLC